MSALDSADHRAPDVVVLGDVMTDVIARVDDPLALGSDTAAQVRTSQGGAGGNVAAWLAALDVPVLFVGRVGDDPFGREAVEVLAAGGVRTAVAVDPQHPTGTVVVLVGAQGERTMLPDAGANSALQDGDLPPSWAGARHLHVSGYTVLNPGSRAVGLRALAVARDAGLTTSVDAASTAPLQVLGGKEFLRLTDGVDLAFCTAAEAEVLVASTEPDVVLARLTATYRTVVLKLGASGARCAADGRAVVTVPAAPAPDPVLDSTGAGDAFAAAFLAAALPADLLARAPAAADGTEQALIQALTRACATAAEVVGQVGARPQRGVGQPRRGVSPGSRR